MPAQSSTFCQLPLDILQNIAFEVAIAEPLGLLDDLVALLQTCHHVHCLLSSTYTYNSYLYGRIFRHKFDSGSAARRFGDTAMYSRNLCSQLYDYCTALRCIRSGNISASTDVIKKTFWSSFFLLIENDGKNYAQLQWAGLGDFVDRFVRERLWDGHDEHHGWAVDSAVNSLALYLMWYTTDDEILRTESSEARRQLMEITRPYVIAPFRFSPFHAPDYFFHLPPLVGSLADPPAILRTPHGPYPRHPRHEELAEHVHYGISLRMRPPLIAIYAGLLYFARSEAVTYRIPTEFPADRAAAHARGIHGVGPTQEDFQKFNAHKGACVVPKGSWHLPEGQPAPSMAWEDDWNRMRHCLNPYVGRSPRRAVYTYGSLAGNWLGRMLTPDRSQYLAMVRSTDYAPGKPMMATLPISFCLREHHFVSPHSPVPCAAQTQQDRYPDDGITNAWFPAGTVRVERNNALEVTTARDGRVYKYETYREGKSSSHDESICASCRAQGQYERASGAERIRATEYIATYDFAPTDYAHDVASALEVVQTALGPDDLEDVLNAAEDEARAMYGSESHHVGDEGECGGARDIILTGETLPNHSEAWHHFTFYGRVRPWDGLVALVRVPSHNHDLGTTIFRGYVIANQNFIGSWRAWSRPQLLPLEGPFIASRAPNAE
ncbi:uncharacterized protein PHACADRAFT_248766 [Phanerochaete carnosa HHB-10118-sp]|uniref:F-box domain-containing protein n=1 Tax=Phanerochaete carnosa (strain HHB-10118-sp) TaxID=650164 RepID=K5WQY8_PHACS|nr:uncharacterized protein PHACADRAFT_248766 [Phanerochaete carnosa HHB-10118-sp]EKM61870.1 hypothetical protein PHACADRAFT_248766 [Phanerochaete carnosa HHB-10118-sp]